MTEDELAHYGIKGMKWGVRSSSKFRPSNWVAVKEGTPLADRIGKESQAREKVSKAKTVSAHQKALDELAAVQRKNRIAAGKAKAQAIIERHGAEVLVKNSNK